MPELLVNESEILSNAMDAAGVFSQLDQEQTDRIVKAVHEAAFNNRVRLAKLAHEETGIGRWEHKAIKNVVAAQLVYNDIKNLKTVGVISRDEEAGIVEIAQPLGPIFAVIPVTNPTSTVIFKILIALKTRNPIIIGPHPRALKCCMETARICYEAALKEDAPENCIQCLPVSSLELTQNLMAQKGIALILATGGPGLVKAAYSSGNPALGVGSGNVPVFVEDSADFEFAAEQIMMSKTFDNGTICASEQALVVERRNDKVLRRALEARGAHFLTPDQIRKVSAVAYDTEKHVMNAAVVGQSVSTIARMAKIDVPPETMLLVAPLKGVGRNYPLSAEILAPILAYYAARDYRHAVNLCLELNFYGGIGHTVSLYSNNEEKIVDFAGLVNAGRIVVNTPSSQGAVGGIFNKLHPSFTLGCGTSGKNITTDNVTARHLLNIQRIARRRVNDQFVNFDTALYLDEKKDIKTIETLYERNR